MAGLGEVTLLYIEVKREAGVSGDAQQEGIAYYLRGCTPLAEATPVATTRSLLPAMLLTVRSTVVSSFNPLLQAQPHSLAPWVLLSSCQV